MTKKITAILLCTCFLFSVSACGKKTPGEGAQSVDKDTKGSLVVGCQEMAGVFSPIYYSTSYDGYVVDMVFDRLIKQNEKGDWEPSAAKNYTYEDDDKSIVFHLKDHLKFSDGEAVTADDVVFTYTVMADPSYTGRYGATVKDMVGYEEFSSGKEKTFRGVEARDPKTVVFHFKEKLRTNLENCKIPIMPKHYYGKDYTVGNTKPVENLSVSPMGSGPYKLTKFSPKEYAALTRNDQWTGGGYAIANIVCKFVNTSTEATELKNGSIDLLPSVVELKKIQTLKKDQNLQYNSYPRNGYGYIAFNCESGPTADKRVRQALAYSFNINEYIQSDYTDKETGEKVATTQYYPISQVSWAVDDSFQKSVNNYSFDMDKAAKLLEEAGWKMNSKGVREKNGQPLELKIAAMPDHPVLSTLIPIWERDWGKLGVKINVAFMEFNTLADYVETSSDQNVDKWNIFFMAAAAESNDPHDLYSTFHSSHIGSGNSNYARYKNAEVDKLLDEGKSIMDRDKAKPIYQSIGRILNDDLPILPVYANTYFDFYNKKLTGFKTNSLYDWVEALKDAKIS